MPIGYEILGTNKCDPFATADGSIVIFQGKSDSVFALFSCDINAGIAVKIMDLPDDRRIYLGNAF